MHGVPARYGIRSDKSAAGIFFLEYQSNIFHRIFVDGIEDSERKLSTEIFYFYLCRVFRSNAFYRGEK